MPIVHFTGHGSPVVRRGPPPAVTVARVRQGRVEGGEYRLADAPDEGFVRVVGRTTRIAAGSGEWAESHLDVPTAELSALARLCRAWEHARVSWAAYVGRGETSKFVGYSPFWHFAPGGRSGKEIPYNDPRLPRFRERADVYKVAAAGKAERLGEFPVRHRLVSGLDEPVGVVAEAPIGRCAVLVREALLLAPRWPKHPRTFAPVALWLVRRTQATSASPALVRRGVELERGLVELVRASANSLARSPAAPR